MYESVVWSEGQSKRNNTINHCHNYNIEHGQCTHGILIMTHYSRRLSIGRYLKHPWMLRQSWGCLECFSRSSDTRSDLNLHVIRRSPLVLEGSWVSSIWSSIPRIPARTQLETLIRPHVDSMRVWGKRRPKELFLAIVEIRVRSSETVLVMFWKQVKLVRVETSELMKP